MKWNVPKVMTQPRLNTRAPARNARAADFEQMQISSTSAARMNGASQNNCILLNLARGEGTKGHEKLV